MNRRDILDVSAELFARRGYKATNLRMVADRLGVTRQALYYHFVNKAEILGALFDEQMTALEASVSRASPSPGGSRFFEIIRGHLEVILDNVDLTAVLVHERPETDAIEGLRAQQRRRAYTKQLVLAYSEDISAGVVRDADPARAANIVLSAANGVIWWYHPRRGPVPSNIVLEETMTILWQGFSPT